MHWYVEVLKKYAIFRGRARRKEYWMFILFFYAFWGVLVLIEPTETLSSLYLLAGIVPGFAVAVRRLHDTNRSGWWMLLGPLPLISLVLLVFLVQDSQEGENQYGPNPKMAASSDFAPDESSQSAAHSREP